ncbi:hypothetical protein ACS0TY_006406 [Phlomoides rotata]
MHAQTTIFSFSKNIRAISPMSQPPPPSGVHEEAWSKNRLQQFAQRASLPLPVYRTLSEGSPHAPAFICQVWVNGTCFTSPNSYSTRKVAEQEAAKIALIGLHDKIKNEASSRIIEGTIFCKSIIYEYAVKMSLLPTYVTNQSTATLPTFVSSLVLNGVTYVGDAGKSKKEAEQFAARSAILSILGSESSTTMVEIVKSKLKLHDALKQDKEPVTVRTETNSLKDINGSSEILGDNVSSGVLALETRVSVNKRKEVNDSGGTTLVELPESTLGQPTNTQVMGQSLYEFKRPRLAPSSAAIAPPNISMSPASVNLVHLNSTLDPSSNTCGMGQSLHEFKNPKLATSSATIAPPIEFVPPASGQAMVCSTSGKKMNRNRKKRKAKKKMELQSPSPISMVPQSAC